MIKVIKHIVSLCILIFSPIIGFAGNTIIINKGDNIITRMSIPNTRYVICHDFYLKEKTLKIPYDSELEFRGGSIRGGTIIFNDTKIINPSFSSAHFQGSTYECFFNIADYGARAGVEEDNSILINELIALKNCIGDNRNAKTIYIPNGVYYIKNPIILWAGWESPITLKGNGNTSTIYQLSDNTPIIEHFECHYIKNLKLTYKNRQGLDKEQSTAIACQRATYSLFENLTICKAKSAFGYLSLPEQNNSYNPTGYSDQCYVSCSFRNIRIYESSGYALDFKKEKRQGDSGSSFDNIYINCRDWLCNTSDNITEGAIRGDNMVASFTQLNVEGNNYSNILIDIGGFSRIDINSLHIESLVNMPMIARTTVQSFMKIDVLDVQNCSFGARTSNVFVVNDNGIIDIDGMCVRPDCKFEKGRTYNLKSGLVQGKNAITIKNVLNRPNALK